jgi:hypothetical protein
MVPDAALGFWVGVIPSLLFGAANLRWSKPPLPWVGVILYAVVMLFVLFFAALWIACLSYGLCL